MVFKKHATSQFGNISESVGIFNHELTTRKTWESSCFLVSFALQVHMFPLFFRKNKRCQREKICPTQQSFWEFFGPVGFQNRWALRICMNSCCFFEQIAVWQGSCLHLSPTETMSEHHQQVWKTMLTTSYKYLSFLALEKVQSSLFERICFKKKMIWCPY